LPENSRKNNCKTIAYPAISTGAYGVSIADSVNIVKEFLEENKNSKIKAIFVLYSKEAYDLYKKNIHNIFIKDVYD
jgi:O-acetyl-ADP-ribose deacetylase (regulator of RNase III)